MTAGKAESRLKAIERVSHNGGAKHTCLEAPRVVSRGRAWILRLESSPPEVSRSKFLVSTD
jgi:hypothetical protein